MKKTTASKILGIAVIIAMLASLILAAVPASALSITKVTVTPSSISVPAEYKIEITGSLNLKNGDTVTVTFPNDTSLSSLGTAITATTAFLAGDAIAVTTAGTITGDGILEMKWITPITAATAVAVGDDIWVTTAGKITGDGILTMSLNGAGATTGPWDVVAKDNLKATVAGSLTAIGTAAGKIYQAAATTGPWTVSAGDRLLVTVTGNLSAIGTAAGKKYNKADATFNAGAGAGDVSVITSLVIDTNARQVTLTVPPVPFATPQPPAADSGNGWVVIIKNVTNPNTPASYTLNVKTSQEKTDVTSGGYNIGIAALISRINKQGYQVATYTKLADALAAVQKEDKISLSAATYKEDVTTPAGIEKVTITSATGKKEDVIIEGSITVQEKDWTIDMVTIKAGTATTGGIVTKDSTVAPGKGENLTIKNVSIVRSKSDNPAQVLVDINNKGAKIDNSTLDTTSGAVGTDTGIDIGANGSVTVSNTTFLLNQDAGLNDDIGIKISAATANDEALVVDKCTFTGSSGVGIQDNFGSTYVPPAGSTVKGWTVKYSTFTNLSAALYVGATSITGTFINNTVTGATDDKNGAINITAQVTNLTIASNTIQGGKGNSIVVKDGTADNVRINGNSISGSAKGLDDKDVTPKLNAKLNYWGAASGPTYSGNTGGTGEKISDNVEYKPFMTVPPTAARVGTAPKNEAMDNWPSDSLTTVGIDILNYKNGSLSATAVVIGQNLGTNNPKTVAPPFPAKGYFDIYTSQNSGTNMQVKLYVSGLKTNSQAFFWSGVQNNWVLCDNQGVAGTGDYVYININTSDDDKVTIPANTDLVGTAFVIVDGVAPAPATLTLNTPEAGANTALTNVPFTWNAVSGSTGYQFVLSEKADLSSPVISTSVTGTAYTFTGTLKAVPYYWQVSALQGTTVKATSNTGAFVAVAPAAPTVVLNAPAADAKTATSNVPFTWSQATGATSYRFVMSAKADLTTPVVDTTIAGGGTTAYTYPGILAAGLPYYWRVTALSGTTVLATSELRVFTPAAPVTSAPAPTISIPPISIPPAVTVTPPPAITVTQAPPITVSIPPAPAPQQITPAWIYMIVGIGAILVIVVIVLIVRTRRAA